MTGSGTLGVCASGAECIGRHRGRSMVTGKSGHHGCEGIPIALQLILPLEARTFGIETLRWFIRRGRVVESRDGAMA